MCYLPTQQIFIYMVLDIDRIISFLNKFSSGGDSELKEQEAASSSTGDAGGSTASTGTPMKKWESGRKFGKSYMNDPKYKWNSDRALGKTYMNDPKYKWESGVTRGHANPVP